MTERVVDLDRMRRAYAASQARYRSSAKVTMRATMSIDRDLHLVGRVGRHHLEADEPAERGGDDRGPSALQYFLAGAGF